MLAQKEPLSLIFINCGTWKSNVQNIKGNLYSRIDHKNKEVEGEKGGREMEKENGDEKRWTCDEEAVPK